MLESMATAQAGLDGLGKWGDRNLMMFRMGILVDSMLSVRQ